MTFAGNESSSRNSEIVHGGLYYEPRSLKATLCVAGRHLLYAYCASRGVTAKKLGKILVATSEDQVLTVPAWHHLRTVPPSRAGR